MAAKQKDLTRKLYYYDLELFTYDKQKKKDVPVKAFGDMMRQIFDDLREQMVRGNGEELRITLNTGNQLFLIIDNIEKDCIKYRMVLVRVGALPFIEKEGILESLEDFLETDQNIAEITHCVLFPDDKVVGVEYNFTGAKASAITHYIENVCDYISLVSCKPKVTLNVFSKIDKKEGFTLFDLAIKRDSNAYNEFLRNKTIFRALWESTADADVIEVVVKKKRGKKGTDKFMSVLTIDEMKRLTKEYRDDIEKFGVSQGSITSDSINLLSDKYVKKATFRQKNGRVIDSEAVYREIKRFFTSEIKE